MTEPNEPPAHSPASTLAWVEEMIATLKNSRSEHAAGYLRALIEVRDRLRTETAAQQESVRTTDEGSVNTRPVDAAAPAHPPEQGAAGVHCEQEQCVYCKEWYPKPVSLHHTTAECDAAKAGSVSADGLVERLCWHADALDDADKIIYSAKIRDLREAAARITELEGEVARLKAGLRTIAQWKDFPPATGRDGKPSTYGLEYGSNGERDYMRQIALNALNAPAQSAARAGSDGT